MRESHINGRCLRHQIDKKHSLSILLLISGKDMGSQNTSQLKFVLILQSLLQLAF